MLYRALQICDLLSFLRAPNDHVKAGHFCKIKVTCTVRAAFQISEEAAAVRAKHAASIPLGRMARPEEIAAAMLFLASEDSSFVAGSELLVDGGMCSV